MPKISIIVASDKIDKIIPAAILATTAAISGWEAEIFFTFWGILAIKRGYEPKEVSSDYKNYQNALEQAMTSKNMPKWKEMLIQGKKTGKLKIYACSTTMDLLGIKEGDLEEIVDGIVGAATFLSKAKNSDLNFFIT